MLKSKISSKISSTTTSIPKSQNIRATKATTLNFTKNIKEFHPTSQNVLAYMMFSMINISSDVLEKMLKDPVNIKVEDFMK
jgi:hypothetical protein